MINQDEDGVFRSEEGIEPHLVVLCVHKSAEFLSEHSIGICTGNIWHEPRG